MLDTLGTAANQRVKPPSDLSPSGSRRHKNSESQRWGNAWDKSGGVVITRGAPGHGVSSLSRGGMDLAHSWGHWKCVMGICRDSQPEGAASRTGPARVFSASHLRSSWDANIPFGVPGTESALSSPFHLAVKAHLGGSRKWLMQLSACHPCLKPEQSSRLLTAAWPRPAVIGIWEVNQRVGKISLFLPNLLFSNK